MARDTDATLDTMVPDAYVYHVPVMTGGVGREDLRGFYSRLFIPRMPPDTEIAPVSRTIAKALPRSVRSRPRGNRRRSGPR